MVPIEQLLEGADAYRQTHRRPLVTLSYAQSLDGCIAAHPGKPLRLSGPDSLRLTHRLRAAHAAILVGIGTILADNPRLTVRLVAGISPQPIVLDSHLRFPLGANLLQVSERSPWIVTTDQAPSANAKALQSAGAHIISFEADPRGQVPLKAMLERLAQEGIASLMVEGGARTITAFLEHRLVDNIILTVTPFYVGGVRAFAPQDSPADGIVLREMGSMSLGDDWIVWGKLS